MSRVIRHERIGHSDNEVRSWPPPAHTALERVQRTFDGGSGSWKASDMKLAWQGFVRSQFQRQLTTPRFGC